MYTGLKTWHEIQFVAYWVVTLCSGVLA